MTDQKLDELYSKFEDAIEHPTKKEEKIMKETGIHDVSGRICHPFQSYIIGRNSNKAPQIIMAQLWHILTGEPYLAKGYVDYCNPIIGILEVFLVKLR